MGANKLCKTCVELKVAKPKRARFGTKNEFSNFCGDHKTAEMYDKSKPVCESCLKSATFNLPGGKPAFCKDHKKENMVDVKSKMCYGCGILQGSFGYTKNELFCRGCAKDDMKNLRARLCSKCNLKFPSYNFNGQKEGLFCLDCADPRMVDVISPKCASCGLFQVHKKTDLCNDCNPEKLKHKKTDEMKCVNFLRENNINFIHNKSVGFECGNFKPDVKIDAKTHILIVEVDENQHKQYNSKCELTRMLNIYVAEGMRCVFLRYNPSSFKIGSAAAKISSKERLKILLDLIKIHTTSIPDDEVTIYKMFFDQTEDVKNFTTKWEIDFDTLREDFTPK